MTVLFVLAAIMMIGIMITVHECGHFFAARATGIPVKSFGIGFGPKIAQWKSKKHETDFLIRLIPAGGYCMFYGEDDPDAKVKNDPRALNNHAVWKRLVTIVMGPVANFLLALVVAVALFFVLGETVGIDYGYVQIESVVENSAAQQAGIMPGDIIKEINGKDMIGVDDLGQAHALQVIGAFQEGDAPLEMTVVNGEEERKVYLSPQMDPVENRMMIGVTCMVQAEAIKEKCSVFKAVKLGGEYCLDAATVIVQSLKNLITTREGIEDTGGPVRIIQTVTETTRDYGFVAYLELLIVISVNLGIVNLLPIPGLDGSRAVFLIIEGIFRKPVPQKIEAYIHMAGYLVLIGLFIVLTYRDILHLFQ